MVQVIRRCDQRKDIMLPGLRLVLTAIAATVAIVVLGFAQLVKLQVAQSHSATLTPVEARFAVLAFAERADWTPAATGRRRSLEALAPFAAADAADPPRIDDAAKAAVGLPPPPTEVTHAASAPDATEWRVAVLLLAAVPASAALVRATRATPAQVEPPTLVAALPDSADDGDDAVATPELTLPDESLTMPLPRPAIPAPPDDIVMLSPVEAASVPNGIVPVPAPRPGAAALPQGKAQPVKKKAARVVQRKRPAPAPTQAPQPAPARSDPLSSLFGR
jgi:hypothetical protein